MNASSRALPARLAVLLSLAAIMVVVGKAGLASAQVGQADQSYAHVLYVAPTGSDSNDGSAAQPFASISHAAKVVQPSTIVHVAPGSYTTPVDEELSGTPSGRITFVSDQPWAAKLATRGSGANVSFYAGGDYVDIVGFDVSGDGYLGIETEGSYVRVSSNRVHDVGNAGCNGAYGGAGIMDQNYAAHDNEISDNVVFNIGPQSFCQGIHGIYVTNLRAQVWNNIAYHNSGWGIHCWHACNQGTLANNLVFDNRSGGIIFGAGDAPGGVTTDQMVVTNNIALDNTAYGISDYGLVGSANQISHNEAQGNTSGDYHLLNNAMPSAPLSVAPDFVNWQADGSGDYHLQAGSPLIAAGTSLGAPATYFDGTARPQAQGIDIGPFESASSTPQGSPSGPPSTAAVSRATATASATIQVAATSTGDASQPTGRGSKSQAGNSGTWVDTLIFPLAAVALLGLTGVVLTRLRKRRRW
jgi:pectate lyase-like protein